MKASALLPAAIALLALQYPGACLAEIPAVGPAYHGPPPVEIPAAFKNGAHWKKAQPRDAQERGAWWTVFRDPVLERLEQQALSANQDIALAVDRLTEVRAQVRQAAADFYPNLALEPTAVRERLSNSEPFQRGELLGNNPFGSLLAPSMGTPSASSASTASSSAPLILDTQPLTRTYNVFRLPADLNWELDLFGRVRRNKEAARAAAQASVADLHNTLLSVTASVASTYYDIRALDAELGVLQRTIGTRQDALNIAQERLNAGLTSDLDVSRATSELASDQAALYGVRRTRQEMENSLATLLGFPASDFRLTQRALTATRVPNIPPGLPADLLERRPDVAYAERQLAAQNARVGVAVAAFFPVIKLTGAAGFESADLGSLLEWQSRIWQIGPSISLPIFEGGRNVANLRAAQAQYQQQVDAYRKQVLIAFQDVESSLGDLHALSDQADAEDRAVASAVRALELSQRQYEKGANNFLDVLDSERTLLEDERVSVQLFGQRLQATVQLIKALGGSWASE